MEFRDLKKQYEVLNVEINNAVKKVLRNADFIHGSVVSELECELADYVGVRYCVSCANGTDAIQLALMCWGTGTGDAVFVPDFTFFSTGEAPAVLGATPIFVDVDKDTFNMDPISLERAILAVIKDGRLTPKVIITVDLFGQPADYPVLKGIAEKYNLLILEDGAQGFGGQINEKKACSFGDISTTSFFPAKPLGCYGDGGAVFTDNGDWAEIIRSLSVHGKGKDKYDNVRLGMNSRLDTIQAAILQVKLKAFIKNELSLINMIAQRYDKELFSFVKVPMILNNFISSWAQYTIQLEDKMLREKIRHILRKNEVPTVIYYPKPLHKQRAFCKCDYISINNKLEHTIAEQLSNKVLSLPISPYMEAGEQAIVIELLKRELCV